MKEGEKKRLNSEENDSSRTEPTPGPTRNNTPRLYGEPYIQAAPSYQIPFPLFDASNPKPTGQKYKRRQVQKTLAEIRRLHDELNARLYAHPTERPAIHSPSEAFDILQNFLADLDHEELWVMLLDTRNRLMNLVQLYKGSVNSSQIRVAEVFRQAMLDNAPSIIIAHNHPSGNPAPSHDDIGVTRAISQAGKLLDIDVLDHIVVSKSGYVSLKEKGLGFGG